VNRQDAKDAKEIESLEKGIIGPSNGYQLHESPGLVGARKGALKLGPKTYTYTYTYTAKRYTFTYTTMRRVEYEYEYEYEGLSISQILVEIEIEIGVGVGIGIDGHPHRPSRPHLTKATSTIPQTHLLLPYLEAVRKGLRIRMGRYPAEIAEGAEVYREGEKGPTSEPFSTTALVN